MENAFINQIDTDAYLNEQREKMEEREATYNFLRERITEGIPSHEVPLFFSEILNRKLDSDQKYRLSTELFETRSINNPHLDIEINNKIQIWRTRWHWQRAHADLIGKNGPHDYALTIRFQRNYTPSHCVNLTKAFCADFYSSVDGLGYNLSIAGSREPDSLPVTKDMSFHLHGSFSLRDSTGAPADPDLVAERVYCSVNSIRDYAKRRAIALTEIKLRPLFYGRGWYLYSAKLAQRLKGEFTPNVFVQRGGGIEFL